MLMRFPRVSFENKTRVPHCGRRPDLEYIWYLVARQEFGWVKAPPPGSVHGGGASEAGRSQSLVAEKHWFDLASFR